MNGFAGKVALVTGTTLVMDGGLLAGKPPFGSPE